MSRQDVINREAQQRPLVVAASLIPLLLFFVGAGFQSSVVADGDTLPSLLRAIDDNANSLTIGAIASGIAFLLLVIPVLFLFRAAQARSENILGGFIVLPFIGLGFYGIQSLLFAFAQLDVASKFVDQEAGTGDIYTLATNLSDDSSLIGIAGLIQFIGIVASIIILIYTPLWGARTGLLTRFQGTFGMALGGSLVLIMLGGSAAAQITFPALFLWFAYFGVQQSGRVKAGRPPAWAAGEAVPWPSPGEEPAEPRPLKDDVVEGDAAEIPGVGEVNPNAARRERAKKRKRKRRS